VIYEAYQAQEDFFLPFRAAAELVAANLKQPLAGPFGNFLARGVAAGAELVSRAKLIHERPDFGITTIKVAGRETQVFEDVAAETAFGTLLHFRKEPASRQPPVLLVAPMAGHFATLLRDTVRTLLPDHDVYVTDWHNARDIPRAEGPFGL
jgi:polyhydroxyalkanoate depolymerase